MDTNSLRLSTNTESIEILNSEGVIDRLIVAPKEIEHGDQYIINDRMLLILIELDDYRVEAHIAEPKDHWHHIHDDIAAAIELIISEGYNEIYTNVRNDLKTTINLLAKHNFVMIDAIENEVILRWELKQH